MRELVVWNEIHPGHTDPNLETRTFLLCVGVGHQVLAVHLEANVFEAPVSLTSSQVNRKLIKNLK